MTELGSVYAAGRQRVIEAVSGLSESEAEQRVAACPEWSVKDVLAHLAGICDDILTGNVEGVATDPWTAAQVEKRKDSSLADVLAEWAEKGPQIDPLVEFFPGMVGRQFIADFTSHEHDVRQAIGAPGARDEENVFIALEFFVNVGMATGMSVRGLPPLEVQAGDFHWVLGGAGAAAADSGDAAAARSAVASAAGAVLTGGPVPLADVTPEAVLKVSPFDLMRALSGRRSEEQIRAFAWSVDPTPYLPLFSFGPFTTRPDPLDE